MRGRAGMLERVRVLGLQVGVMVFVRKACAMGVEYIGVFDARCRNVLVSGIAVVE
jgi:hypothetical protein